MSDWSKSWYCNKCGNSFLGKWKKVRLIRIKFIINLRQTTGRQLLCASQ
jgi:ribosomal protein L37AE/L43A